MTRQGKRINCDLCSRQIVPYKATGEYCVGPGGHSIGFGKHCCNECWPDYLNEGREQEGKALEIR